MSSTSLSSYQGRRSFSTHQELLESSRRRLFSVPSSPILSSNFLLSKKELSFPTHQQIHASCHPQTSFSFPKPVIDYILKASKSAALYQKIIYCCKEFLIKNPILVIRDLEYSFSFDGIGLWRYFQEDTFILDNTRKPFDLQNFKGKIWITGRLIFSDTAANIVPELIPKLYQSNATFLHFVRVKISFADLKLLSSLIKKCTMIRCLIDDQNGESIPLEDLIELFSGTEEFTISQMLNNQVKDYKKLVDACSSIKQIWLNNLNDDFDMNTFAKFLKKAKCPSHISYYLEHATQNSYWNPYQYVVEENDSSDYNVYGGTEDEDMNEDFDVNNEEDELMDYSSGNDSEGSVEDAY